MDLVTTLFAHARILRMQALHGLNSSRVGGFTYRVEGPHVLRYGPKNIPELVWSTSEIKDSLTAYQLAQLRQNRRRTMRTV